MFKHLNSTDDHIVSEDRSSEKYISFNIHSFICYALWVYLGKGQSKLVLLEKLTLQI